MESDDDFIPLSQLSQHKTSKKRKRRRLNSDDESDLIRRKRRKISKRKPSVNFTFDKNLCFEISNKPKVEKPFASKTEASFYVFIPQPKQFCNW